MELTQCMNCGHGGWTSHELKEGLCPICWENEKTEYDLKHENYVHKFLYSRK